MTILVTGATGFIGRSLVEHLLVKDHEVIAGVRTLSNSLPVDVKQTGIGELSAVTDWQQALLDVDVVIHLAARVHIMKDASLDPLVSFRAVNTEGTLNLARQAAAKGVLRFIFLSSIKVNGEQTTANEFFTADETFLPSDPYGISKYEAEMGLKTIAAETGMEVVIIRSPLVYGRGVKGNFLSMMKWVQRGVPLPLGATHNKRSLVALDNLLDLIIVCIDHPAAANQAFLVSDGEDISTSELLRRLGFALGKPARLLPVPQVVIACGLGVIGKKAIAQRLCGSLQVDISKTRDLLGWQPPVSIDDALKKVAER